MIEELTVESYTGPGPTRTKREKLVGSPGEKLRVEGPFRDRFRRVGIQILR